jgi:5-methylcytosine-specific restriction protein A
MPMRPPTHRAYVPAPVKRASAAKRGYGGPAWEAIRKRVLKRDKWRCVLCKAPLFAKGSKPNVDHIVDKSSGGTNEDSNLRTLCPSCHSSRTATESGGFGNARHAP